MAAELFLLKGTIAIDVTDATQKINGIITAGKDLEAKLNGIGNNAEASIGKKSKFSEATIWLGNMLTQLSNKVFDLGVDFVKLGFTFNSSVETYTATFKSMLGLTEEEASAMFERLRAFAVETPYQMSGVAESAIRLFNAGYNTDEVLNMLETLGNIAGGDSQKLERLIKAFTDTKGYGFLRAQERNQFVENGVLIYDILSDYYEHIGQGMKTADEIAQMQANKAISYEDVWNALVLSTQEGYRYHDRMAELMQTWGGKTEKLSDNLQETAGAVTNPFFEIIRDETIDKLSELLDKVMLWAEENPEVLENLASALTALAANGLNALVTSLTDLLTFWNDHKAEFDSMLVLLGGLAIYKGHPVAGAALVAVGAGDAYAEGQNKIEEAGLNENPENLYTPDSALYNSVKTGVDSGLTGFEKIVKSVNEFALPIVASTPFFTVVPPDSDVSLKTPEQEAMEDKIDAGFEEFINIIFGKPRDNKPRRIIRNSVDDVVETYDPSTTETHSIDDIVPGINPSANPAMLVSMLQQTLSTLKADVTEASREGVAAGLSGVTITGTVNTGNVQLDGVVVGKQLAPHVNFQLGWLGKLSDRG